MQQSRLDKFFIIKKSDDNSTTNKRLLPIENENNKKFKRTKSDSNTLNNEDNFSLNQFYLNKFLLILSSLLKYHKCLFDENELILFNKFQILPG
jgi:hypothetical protein